MTDWKESIFAGTGLMIFGASGLYFYLKLKNSEIHAARSGYAFGFGFIMIGFCFVLYGAYLGFTTT